MKVVRLRLIGPADAVAVVEEFLTGEFSTRDVRFEIGEQRCRSRRALDAVRSYAEIELPFYLFEEEAQR